MTNIIFQNTDKVHNSKSVYQQWQFNDLTQKSQTDNRITSSSEGAQQKGAEVRRDKHQDQTSTFHCHDELQFACTLVLTAENKLFDYAISDNMAQKNQKQKRDNMATKHDMTHEFHEFPMIDEKPIRQKNYGKIKIMCKRPTISRRSDPQIKIMPYKIGVVEKRQKKKISSEIFDKCIDPFAFVTISDQIKHLTPDEACLKLPYEFSVAREQISKFEAKWAHRTSEF